MSRKNPKDPSRLVQCVSQDLRTDLDLLIQKRLLTLTDETQRFRYSYLASSVWSKYVGEDTLSSSERRQAAITKLLSVEARNAKANRRLMFFWDDTDFGYFTSRKLVLFAQRLIESVIGTAPPDDILFGEYTGGASTSIRRGVGSIARKYMDAADVTPSCWKRIHQEVERYEGWKNSAFPEGFTPRFVEGNVLFTVPKSSTIDRCAAKEPDLNMFAQKGVGNFFRRCLRKHGINLNDQTRNQRLAFEGSVSGKLATIDLSSASDSVTCSLVALLLPPKWYHLLDDIRSQVTNIDGDSHINEMFSSMGNGFTFELESLIFWALTRSITYHLGVRGTVSVYGDDIICPSSVAPLLVRVFHFFGFTANSSKSFWKGKFRESCGKHYYAGSDVTPFYVKEPVSSQVHLIHFLNRLRKWSIRESLTGRTYLDEGLYPIWKRYSRYVDRRFHGGRDLERKDALVTASKPRELLVPVTRRAKYVESTYSNGAYIHWLRSAALRGADDSPGLLTSVSKRDVVGSNSIKRVVFSHPTHFNLLKSVERGLTVSFDLVEPLVTSNFIFDTSKYRSVRNKADLGLALPLWNHEVHSG